MNTYTATITVPIFACLTVSRVTDRGIEDCIHETLEPHLTALEEQGTWNVTHWGWHDTEPVQNGKTRVHLSGLAHTSASVEAKSQYEAYDYFTDDFTPPSIDLPEVFDCGARHYVSVLTDGETTWKYDDRGFIVHVEECNDA